MRENLEADKKLMLKILTFLESLIPVMGGINKPKCQGPNVESIFFLFQLELAGDGGYQHSAQRKLKKVAKNLSL